MKVLLSILFLLTIHTAQAQSKAEVIKELNEFIKPVVGKSTLYNSKEIYTKATFRTFANDFIGYEIQTTNESGKITEFNYAFSPDAITNIYDFNDAKTGELTYLSLLCKSGKAFETQRLVKDDAETVRFNRQILHVPYVIDGQNAYKLIQYLMKFAELKD